MSDTEHFAMPNRQLDCSTAFICLTTKFICTLIELLFLYTWVLTFVMANYRCLCVALIKFWSPHHTRHLIPSLNHSHFITFPAQRGNFYACKLCLHQFLQNSFVFIQFLTNIQGQNNTLSS